MLMKSIGYSMAALLALTGVAQADYLELPNVVIDSPEVKTAQLARRGDGMCWDLDSITFRVRNRDLVVRSVSVRYENGNTDQVSGVAGRRFPNGPQAYGPFPIVKSGNSGWCVASVTIAGDDVDGDRSPGRPRRPSPSYSVVDFEAFGRLIARNERPPVVRPEPPVVILPPPPRPSPVYETRTRTVLDLESKELIANPSILTSVNQEYSVYLSNPERVGAIQLEAKYDDAFIDEVIVGFANGEAQKIELGSFTSDGWVIRDGSIYLGRNQRTGILDLMGFGERRVTSITIRGREGAAGEANSSGLKPVIEVFGIGYRTESYTVCVANCN